MGSCAFKALQTGAMCSDAGWLAMGRAAHLELCCPADQLQGFQLAQHNFSRYTAHPASASRCVRSSASRRL